MIGFRIQVHIHLLSSANMNGVQTIKTNYVNQITMYGDIGNKNMKIIKDGRWKLPKELFEQYLRMINATERSSERYNYDFDQLRQSIHCKILNHVGLMSHTTEYREFQRALQDLCEEMLPARNALPKVTKLNNPTRGITGVATK